MDPRPTVLVVDDDHDLRESVMELLDEHGYQAVGAVDGREALYLLHTSSPQPVAIILDLMLPVLDGLRFREEQLGDPVIAGIPVIVMTAHSRSPAPLLRAAGFLHKPFPSRDLLEMLRATHRAA
jgi:CheY-like chemotaxis protein